MKRTMVVLTVLVILSISWVTVIKKRDMTAQAQYQQIMESYGQIPLSFEANQGQTDSAVQFLSRGNGYNLFLTPAEAVLVLSKPRQASDVLRMRLVGGTPNARVAGLEELAARSNYFIGNNPEQWRTNIANYAKVEYEGVYPGIDMVYYGNQRQLEYDFVVAPGADISPIALSFEGANNIEIDTAGDLVLSTWGGQIRQHRPIIYQEENGERQEIAGGYMLKGANEVGFVVGAYDTSRPLIIDPVLVYSTYLGGSGNDSSTDIIVDSAGNAYLTGHTNAVNFPTAIPFQAANGGGNNDLFVTKLNSSGTGIVFSTYLGGAGDDIGNSIAIDSTGNAYVVGQTSSATFPTTANAYKSSLSGTSDAFLVKFNPSADALLYSTYLGGSLSEQGFGLDVDSSGNAYLSGNTTSTNFPVVDGFQTVPGGGTQEGFVAVLNTNSEGASSLIYSTYLGGNGSTDTALALVLDSSGIVYTAGQTNSTNFPTTANGLLTTYGGGGQDGFMTKIDTNFAGSASLLYSSYIGGNGVDQIADLDVDAAGNAYLGGTTRSPNFPLKNAFQSTLGGSPGIQDAFVMKVNTNIAGSAAIEYSTFLGGKGDDQTFGIAIDSSGNAYVAGITNSPNFPTSNAIQAAFALGPNDIFLTKLNSSGNGLIYSTYLGGSGDDFCRGVATDAKGNAYVIGHTTSTNYPIANAYQSGLSGTQDAFVARIRDLDCTQPLSISSQPANVTACAGSSATFSVTASGTNLTYQWLKNGAAIAGATGSSYTIAAVSDADTGSYDVVITSGCEEIVISTPAQLTVKAMPAIVSQPVSQTVCAGSPASFSVSATGAELRYQWRKNGVNITGASAASYAISSVTAADAGTYDVVVSGACSPVAISAAATLIVNQSPTVSAGGPYVVNEGGSLQLTASGSDPDGDTLSYSWDLDNNGTFETSGQSVSFLAVDGPAVLTVKVKATDGSCALSAVSTATITVNNVAPAAVAITATLDPVHINTAVNASASFSDAGIIDTHSAMWTWGDGTTSAGTVSEANGAGTVTGSHNYTAAGIYTVKLTVTDKDGASSESIFQFIVVYDPEGGFVTGGGFIISPAGAYAENSSVSGKANFGFNSKYQPGANVPTGNTEFQFKLANFNFKSTSYQFLVVAGAKAQFKGSGTINGAGDYNFIVTAIDGQINGSGGADKFRIKITDKATGAIIYDNQFGVDDDQEPTTVIGGGNIVIHK